MTENNYPIDELTQLLATDSEAYEKTLHASVAASRAAQVKNYSTVEFIDPKNKLGTCSYFVQLKFKDNPVENYWFETSLPDDEKAFDNCLRMRIFYNDIEKVVLVADYAADRQKVKALRNLEAFDED